MTDKDEKDFTICPVCGRGPDEPWEDYVSLAQFGKMIGGASAQTLQKYEGFPKKYRVGKYVVRPSVGEKWLDEHEEELLARWADRKRDQAAHARAARAKKLKERKEQGA